MPLTLLVMRHGKSSWSDHELDDHDRPLNPRGQNDVPKIGALARQEGLAPNRILCSTALRAWETAALLAPSLHYEGPVWRIRNLYLATPNQIIDIVRRETNDECIMIIGHNPGFEDIVSSLTKSPIVMPTAALAVLKLPIDSWKLLSLETRGELARLWIPKKDLK